MYGSGKTYVHAIGLSAAFRQWRATSHCRFIHGYAIQFEIKFRAKTLDERNWVVDFGSLKPIKAWLEEQFDHKLLVAEDDPWREHLELLGKLGLAQPVIVKAVGCEAFAKMVYDKVERWLATQQKEPRVFLERVICREHAANYGEYVNPQLNVHPHVEG